MDDGVVLKEHLGGDEADVSVFRINTEDVLISPFYCRSRWLKEPDADSNELFRMVAEIFILWCKSHVSSLISVHV